MAFGSKGGSFLSKLKQIKDEGASLLSEQVSEAKAKATKMLEDQEGWPFGGDNAADIAANEPRKQGYTGADNDMLLDLAKAEFAQYFPDQTILGGVVEGAEWYRSRENVLNTSTGATELRDRSYLTAYIFADEGAGVASQWSVSITKDHVQGDRISAHLDVKLRENPLPSSKVFLVDKI